MDDTEPEPEQAAAAAAATSSYVDELIPYLVLLGNTLLFMLVRRLANRLSPLKWRLAISEAIGTWELCSDVAELGIVYERHGVWLYALALLACCVWWCRSFGDAEACPCGPIEDMLFGIGPGDYRARLLGQAMGGLLTAQSARPKVLLSKARSRASADLWPCAPSTGRTTWPPPSTPLLRSFWCWLNFWDEFDDECATCCETNEASSVSNRGAALETHAKRNATADDCKKSTTKPERTTDDNLFVATGLCAEDLENCFDDDFDECANESEPKKEERNRRLPSGPATNVLPEIPSDMFDDDSVGWLAEEPEVVPRKRKFPGPAGILPKSRSSLSFPGSGMTTGEVSSVKPEPPDDLLCTPWSAEADNPLSPWQCLRQDLGMEDVKDSKLNEYSIAWVLKMKRLQQLPRGKVPVLCTSIKNVAKDILTLRDGTGEILATIDKSCQDYKYCLKAGAAFILMKASVYINDHSQHCLVLTKQNIAHIYYSSDDGGPDINRVDVNPMTLQELECICAQLEREALEDAAKRETLGSQHRNSCVSSCSSPYLESRARNFSPVLPGSTNGRAQWNQGRGNASPSLFSNKGNVGAQSRTKDSKAGSWQTRVEATGAARTSHSPMTSARPKLAQGAGTKRPSGWLKDNVIHPGHPLASPCPPKVPAYKPPVQPSTASSSPKLSCAVSPVVSLLKSAAANKPQIAAQPCALSSATPPKSVVNGTTPVNAAAGSSNLLVPSDNDTSMEELQWLEDDADDIFQTIDDVCLV